MKRSIRCCILTWPRFAGCGSLISEDRDQHVCIYIALQMRGSVIMAATHLKRKFLCADIALGTKETAGWRAISRLRGQYPRHASQKQNHLSTRKVKSLNVCLDIPPMERAIQTRVSFQRQKKCAPLLPNHKVSELFGRTARPAVPFFHNSEIGLAIASE